MLGSPASITRRRFLAAVALLASLGADSAVLSACTAWPRPPTPLDPLPTPTPARRAVEVAVSLPAPPDHAVLPLVHLVRSGFLAGRGVLVQLTWGSTGDALAPLLGEQSQFAILDATTLARAVEAGADLVGVFLLYRQDPSLVFTLDRSGLRDTPDLAGRLVGVARPGAPADALGATLRAAGLDRSAVQTAIAGDALARHLADGRFAAAAGSRHLIAGLQARRLPAMVLPCPGWEHLPGPALVTTRAYLTDRRPSVLALVATLREGLLAIAHDPSPLFHSASSPTSTNPLEQQARLAELDSLVAALRDFPSNLGPGWANPHRLQAAQIALLDLGIVAQPVDLARVLVNDFIPRARP